MKNTFPYSAEDVRRDFGIEFAEAGDKISQFGGLAPFIAFLKKGRFRERLTGEFGVEKTRSILQLALGIIAGADRMRGVARAGQDVLLRNYIGACVGEAQLGRDFKAFTPAELERFHDWMIALSVFDLLRDVSQNEVLIFDVDATSVEKNGEQEGVENGFIERDKIGPCYQYLFFRLHNLNSFLYGSIRGGGAHSQNGICEYLKRFLPMFKGQWETKWRMDSGYFNEGAFDLFSENNATFFVKAPMSESRMSLALTSTDLVWRRSEKNPDEGFASRNTKTRAGTIYREVFRRVKIKRAQLSLLDQAEYRYDCMATNDLVIGEMEAFLFYNGRANIENNIRELKNDYALGKIVTESFNANDAITQCTLFAYLLIGHFKRKLLPPQAAKHQLRTIRTVVFNVPARLLTTARRRLTRIFNVFKDHAFYSRIYYKLRYLRSWVLEPPLPS